MLNRSRICVATFHRGGLSVNEADRQRLGRSRYHWAILIHPNDPGKMGKCIFFDATDGIRYDPIDMTNTNPDQDWWFRVRSKLDPGTLHNFLGAIEIGKLPILATRKGLHELIDGVRLPQKNQTPNQNCVSWMSWAVDALEQAGYVPKQDMQKVMQAASELSEEVIAKGPSSNVMDRIKVL